MNECVKCSSNNCSRRVDRALLDSARPIQQMSCRPSRATVHCDLPGRSGSGTTTPGRDVVEIPASDSKSPSYCGWTTSRQPGHSANIAVQPSEVSYWIILLASGIGSSQSGHRPRFVAYIGCVLTDSLYYSGFVMENIIVWDILHIFDSHSLHDPCGREPVGYQLPFDCYPAASVHSFWTDRRRTGVSVRHWPGVSK